MNVPTPDHEITGAAVDLGSNTFHLVIAAIRLPHIRVIDRIREAVRLAAGMHQDRKIDEETQSRALACLERFGERLRDFPSANVRVVGTNALRQANNAAEFLARARLALGHPIQVISGYEEARLIYAGVTHRLETSSRRRLVIDIGGGSTEVIVGVGGRPMHIESFDVGALSIMLRFFPEGRVTRSAMRTAVLAVGLEIQTFIATIALSGWESVIGSSGSILAVARVIVQYEFGGTAVTYAGLKKVRDLLIERGKVSPADYPYLNPDRVLVLAGGVAILLALFKHLNIESMEVTEGGIRDGILLDIVGRMEQRDIRSTSVSLLAERYSVDADQAQRVARKVLTLYRSVRAAWGIDGAEWPLLLEWAAQLHEVGLAISHGRYHRHSGYIVSNSDLAGFSMEQQSLLGFIVRAQRRKFPKSEWQELPAESRESLLRLSVLFRLAVLLCRGRVQQPPRVSRLIASGSELRVCFARGWLDDNPLTAADLEQEKSDLAEAGFTLIIDSVSEA